MKRNFDKWMATFKTSIAANLLERNFVGIDRELTFLEISKKRRMDLDDKVTFRTYKQKLSL